MYRSLPLIRASTLMSSFTIQDSVRQRAGVAFSCWGLKAVWWGLSFRLFRLLDIRSSRAGTVRPYAVFIGNQTSSTLLAFHLLHLALRAFQRCACDSRSG